MCSSTVSLGGRRFRTIQNSIDVDTTFESSLHSVGFICNRLVGLEPISCTELTTYRYFLCRIDSGTRKPKLLPKWLLIIQGIGLRDKVQSSHFETIATCVPRFKDCWSKWIYMDGLTDNVQPIEMEIYVSSIYTNYSNILKWCLQSIWCKCMSTKNLLQHFTKVTNPHDSHALFFSSSLAFSGTARHRSKSQGFCAMLTDLEIC